MPIRYDSIALPSARIDADGFLYDTPILTRTGVFVYREPDGSMRREYRPPQEVFRADSLASYKGKPITIRHPAAGEVNPGNARSETVGTILSEGRQDGQYVRGDVVIYDPASIGNRRELSCGYRLDVEYSPGVSPEGDAYEWIQKNMQINHLAVTAKARAGSMARLNLDGDEIFENESEENNTMAKIRLDGIEYDAAQEVINALEKQTKAAEAAQTEVVTVRKNLDSVTAERDSLKVKVDAQPAELEKVRTDSLAGFDTAVKARVELLDIAAAYRLDKAEAMSDKDIKVAVIKAVRGDSFDLTGKSDAYLEAAFDFVKNETRLDAMAEQRRIVNSAQGDFMRNDEDMLTSEQRRQRMINNMENAHKGADK